VEVEAALWRRVVGEHGSPELGERTAVEGWHQLSSAGLFIGHRKEDKQEREEMSSPGAC
jgi:hypothetical protein